MESTAVYLTPELRARQAAAHTAPGHRTFYIPLKHVPGSGPLFSTANDMLKLASATLGLTPCPLTPLLKQTEIGHEGATMGFNSLLAFDFEHRRALIVLSNCRDYGLLGRFGVLLKNRSPKPPGTILVSSNVYEQCVGDYFGKDHSFWKVWRDGGRLMIQERGKPRCEIFPQSETHFRNHLFDCEARFLCASNSTAVNELVIGDPAAPRWRGVKIPGSSSPLTEEECRLRKDSDLQGVWKATLRPSWYWPFHVLHLKLRIAELSPGAFRAELDSMDQGANGLPLTVVYKGPSVDMSMLPFQATFQGKINPACTQITGSWKQNSKSIRITFRRVTSALRNPETAPPDASPCIPCPARDWRSACSYP
jgi:hypothetical protein